MSALWNAFRHPVPPENRAHLRAIRDGLPEELHGPRQMHGLQTEGCGATIGVMPRCDFACSGCYLDREANGARPRPLEEIREQMRLVRAWAGRWGNLQLTDGEVTLRPPTEIVALLRFAHELELIPMLMTHGETFRRDPDLLARLVTEGGLRELSIHIDTTQRGRPGKRERDARREEDLHPLRAEFAELLRHTRRRTGVALRAASTVTVGRENLAGVPSIVRWFVRNADAFRTLGMLPVAQVGRTEAGLAGVDRTALWREVAAGLDGLPDAQRRIEHGQLEFGHGDCSRAVMGFVLEQAGREPVYQPLRRFDDPEDERAVQAFYSRWGGIAFRPDSGPVAAARALGMLARTPGLFLRHGPPWLLRWARRLDPERPSRLLARLVTGRARLRGLAIVSHHFMSRAELQTPRGRQRLAACTFRVPLDGTMVPMCSVNATGLRERYYAATGAADVHEQRYAEAGVP